MEEYSIKLEQFEGPLPLLLELIEKEKLDISNISLAKVADQCIAYLERQEFSDPRLLADFLVVVAKLILIKSKLFIPLLETELDEEDLGISLEKQLKIFQRYYLASKKIKQIIAQKHFSFPRQNPIIVEGFYPPKGINKEILSRTLNELITQIEPVVKIPHKTIKRIISLQEKIKQIKKIILEKQTIEFRYLIKSNSLSEIIVTFLAVLELTKEKSIVPIQNNLFEEIKISSYDGKE